jgi:hypothetical protein
MAKILLYEQIIKIYQLAKLHIKLQYKQAQLILSNKYA